MTEERQFLLLAIALAIGLLIGIERGWHGLQAEKSHIPGVRTFGLIGLLGGVVGLLAVESERAVFGLAFVAFSGVMATAHVLGLRRSDHPGITSLIATLLTFSLGALAGFGSTVPAAGMAVVASLLLGFKPWVRHWLSRLEELELHATLKLMLITVVLLPILPNQGYGPGGLLNPYKIWWMVVMIALISFVGYFTVRSLGEEKGVLLTSLFAGLASSTSLTLHFARLVRTEPQETDLLAAGILLAGATLFPRILVIVAVFDTALALALVPAMLAMAACLLIPASLVWLRHERGQGSRALELKNPLELGAVLRFGALLAVVLLVTRYLTDVYGGIALLVVGAVSGLVDLNAITLTVARGVSGQPGAAYGVSAIVLATVTNGLFKSVLSWLAGSGALALRVALPMLVAALAGIAAVLIGGHWPAA